MDKSNPVYAPGEVVRGTPYSVVRVLGAPGFYEVEDVRTRRRGLLETFASPQEVGESGRLVPGQHVVEPGAFDSIRHPNLTDVLACGVAQETADDGTFVSVPYLVTAWLEGASLASVARGVRFSFENVLDVASDVLSALGYLHQGRSDVAKESRVAVVHGCVAPNHIFLVSSSAASAARAPVKLLGLGRARLLDGDSVRRQSHVAYTAPEQWRGDRLSPQTDFYSAACVFFELLTGHPPFGSAVATPGEREALATSHVMSKPPRASDFVQVPPRVDDVLYAALSKRPEDRPRDAYAFVTLMRALREKNASQVAVPLVNADATIVDLATMVERHVEDRAEVSASVAAAREGGHERVFPKRSEGFEAREEKRSVLSVRGATTTDDSKTAAAWGSPSEPGAENSAPKPTVRSALVVLDSHAAAGAAPAAADMAYATTESVKQPIPPAPETAGTPSFWGVPNDPAQVAAAAAAPLGRLAGYETEELLAGLVGPLPADVDERVRRARQSVVAANEVPLPPSLPSSDVPPAWMPSPRGSVAASASASVSGRASDDLDAALLPHAATLAAPNAPSPSPSPMLATMPLAVPSPWGGVPGGHAVRPQAGSMPAVSVTQRMEPMLTPLPARPPAPAAGDVFSGAYGSYPGASPVLLSLPASPGAGVGAGSGSAGATAVTRPRGARATPWKRVLAVATPSRVVAVVSLGVAGYAVAKRPTPAVVMVAPAPTPSAVVVPAPISASAVRAGPSKDADAAAAAVEATTAVNVAGARPSGVALDGRGAPAPGKPAGPVRIPMPKVRPAADTAVSSQKRAD